MEIFKVPLRYHQGAFCAFQRRAPKRKVGTRNMITRHVRKLKTMPKFAFCDGIWAWVLPCSYMLALIVGMNSMKAPLRADYDAARLIVTSFREN